MRDEGRERGKRELKFVKVLSEIQSLHYLRAGVYPDEVGMRNIFSVKKILLEPSHQSLHFKKII